MPALTIVTPELLVLNVLRVVVPPASLHIQIAPLVKLLVTTPLPLVMLVMVAPVKLLLIAWLPVTLFSAVPVRLIGIVPPARYAAYPNIFVVPVIPVKLVLLVAVLQE